MINLANIFLYNNEFWKIDYSFTADAYEHEFVLHPGTYLLICDGAPGGKAIPTNGSTMQLGGSAYGIINVESDMTLYATVGTPGLDARSDVMIPCSITRDMCDQVGETEEIFIGNESKWTNNTYFYPDGDGGLSTSSSKLVGLKVDSSSYAIPVQGKFLAVDAYHINGTRLKAYAELRNGSSYKIRVGTSAGTIDTDGLIYIHNGVAYVNPYLEYYLEGADSDDPNNRQDIYSSDLRSVEITWYNIKPEYGHLLDSYNGGGYGSLKTDTRSYYNGPGGGGASDIRVISHDDDEIITVETARYSVPEEFQAVEYLESTLPDLQWIDTQYVHNTKTKIVCDLYTDDQHDISYRGWQTSFGSRNHNLYNNAFYMFTTHEYNWRGKWCRSGDEATISPFPYNRKIHVEAYNTTMNITDSDTSEQIITVQTYGTNDNGVCSIALFRLMSSDSIHPDFYDAGENCCFKGKMYGFQIYEGNEIKHYFVPVKRKAATYEIDIDPSDFEQGTVGEYGDVQRSSRVRTSNLIRVDNFKGIISFEAYDVNDNPLNMAIPEYDLDDKSCVINAGSWIGIGNTFSPTSNFTGFIRFLLKRDDESDIDPSDIKSCHITVTNCHSGMYDIIDDVFHANRGMNADFICGPNITFDDIVVIEDLSSSLLSRIIVAGGGGGATSAGIGDSYSDSTGFGGGIYGGFVSSPNDENAGKYPSQSSGYAFGHGMSSTYKSGDINGAGGGGGGWYGGYASITNSEPVNGGGGSGYVLTSTSHKISVTDQPSSEYYLTNTFLDIGSSTTPRVLVCSVKRKLEVGDVIHIPKTNSIQTHTFLPGEYSIKCYGGDGNTRNVASTMARGGYAQGTLRPLVPVNLSFAVGGSGRYAYGPSASYINICNPGLGYNGGGTPANYNYISLAGTAGGGATDVRANGSTLYSRIIVAGGGGGCGAGPNGNRYGGAGGGESGSWDTNGSGYGDIPGPGTQTESPQSGSYPTINGGFGYGGNGVTADGGIGGAGGGGWYGGSGCHPDGSSDDDRGGCGGSGYLYTESSHKPAGYLVTDPSLYISDGELSTGMNTLEYGLTKIEIVVNEVSSTIKILAGDSQGYKYYDTENNTWSLLPTQELSDENFETYGVFDISDDTGLANAYYVYFHDEENEITGCNLYIIPPQQTVEYHLGDFIDITDHELDVSYDESTTTVNHEFEYYDEDEKRKINCIMTFNKTSSSDIKAYGITVDYNANDPKSSRYVTRPTPVVPEEKSLLPVGRPSKIDATYKTNYLSPIGGTTPVTSVNTSAVTMHDRALFIALTLNDTTIRIVSCDVYTNTVRLIAEYPKSTFNSKRVTGILVDDEYYYLTALNGDAHDRGNDYIYTISRNDTTNVTSFNTVNSSYNTIGSGGKIMWLSDTEIVNAHRDGLTIFNTATKSFTYKLQSFDIDSIDFAIGENYIACVDKGSDIHFYNKSTKTWSTVSSVLTYYSLYKAITYGDGKFMIFDNGTVKIYSDETLENTNNISFVSGADVHSMYYTENKLYVLLSDNRYAYAYDFNKNNSQIRYILDWSIPHINSCFEHCIGYGYKGILYVAMLSLGMISYNPNIKYSFGSKYHETTYPINAASSNRMVYDPRFVTFTVSNMIIHDGAISKTVMGESTVKYIYVNKSEYNGLKKIEIITEGE